MSTLDGPPLFGSADDPEAGDGQPSTLHRLRTRTPLPSFRQAAFWTAVVLPFLYVPLLVGGLATTGERVALVGLLAANFVALYLGHDHDPR